MTHSRWLSIFVFCILLLVPVPCSAQGTVRVHVAEYPPYMLQTPDGEWRGIEMDIARDMIKRAGYTPEYHSYTWSRGLYNLVAGRLDVLCRVARTPGREKFMHFIGPTAPERWVVVVGEKDAGLVLDSEQDFMDAGGPWCIRSGFHYAPDFNARLDRDKNFRIHFHMLYKAGNETELIKRDRCRGAIMDENMVRYQLAENPRWKGLTYVRSGLFQPRPVWIAVSKLASPVMIHRLQEAYDEMAASGEIKAIIAKYLAATPAP